MRLPRIKRPGAIYHIYNQGVNRADIFLDQEDPEFWLSLLRGTIHKFKTNVFCFVTMKNHFHCILQTTEPNISDVMWYVGFFFALYMNKKYKRVGPLCRNRFQSQLIENIPYLRNAVCYIHNNPVEAGYIKNVCEKDPCILTSFHCLSGRADEYAWLSKEKLRDLLQIPGEKDFQQLIWQPIGRAVFKELTKIENISQKVLQKAQSA